MGRFSFKICFINYVSGMKKILFLSFLILSSFLSLHAQSALELRQSGNQKAAEGDFEAATALYSRSMEMGDEISILKFGEMIVYKGVKVESYDNALVLMEMAAEKYAEAQYFLGFMYEMGLGTEANPQQAAVAYVYASDNGVAAAEYRLGLFCEKGIGVPQDLEMARRWYTKALEKNYLPALDALRRIDPVGIREIEMVSLKGGAFYMGTDSATKEDGPMHKVEVSPFFISKTEITNHQFCQFLNSVKDKNSEEIINWIKIGGSYGLEKCRIQKTEKGYEVIKGFENFPVIFVTYEGATAYCTWMSEQTGSAYRLPTEAEWEFAASEGKGGGTAPYSYSGHASIDSVAWYVMNSSGGAMPVALLKPNAFGLYDMSGNVWEWCFDYFRSGYYNRGDEKDPKGPVSGVFRVLRGGAWNSRSDLCRVFTRFSSVDSRFDTIGFRVVMQM